MCSPLRFYTTKTDSGHPGHRTMDPNVSDDRTKALTTHSACCVANQRALSMIEPPSGVRL
jgi:hypothetical protein